MYKKNEKNYFFRIICVYLQYKEKSEAYGMWRRIGIENKP